MSVTVDVLRKGKSPTLCGILKRGMKIVDDLGETIGWLLVASFIEQEHLDAP